MWTASNSKDGGGSYIPFYSPQSLLNEWINNAIYLTLGLSTRVEPEARIRVLTVSLGGKSSGKPRWGNRWEGITEAREDGRQCKEYVACDVPFFQMEDYLEALQMGNILSL